VGPDQSLQPKTCRFVPDNNAQLHLPRRLFTDPHTKNPCSAQNISASALGPFVAQTNNTANQFLRALYDLRSQSA